jgi:hypothetical protein
MNSVGTDGGGAEAQPRVCEIRSVVCRGKPAVAMMGIGREVGVSETVCKMCVCGIDTVMTIFRDGFVDGGAVAAWLESSDARWMVL